MAAPAVGSGAPVADKCCQLINSKTHFFKLNHEFVIIPRAICTTTVSDSTVSGLIAFTNLKRHKNGQTVI